jgi:hypothetical protein
MFRELVQEVPVQKAVCLMGLGRHIELKVIVFQEIHFTAAAALWQSCPLFFVFVVIGTNSTQTLTP